MKCICMHMYVYLHVSPVLMLNINQKKNKVIIFQRRAERYDCNFYIGNEKIDIVKVILMWELKFLQLGISLCHSNT